MKEKKDGIQAGAHMEKQMSKIIKNKRRIDPRYFLNETVVRNKGEE